VRNNKSNSNGFTTFELIVVIIVSSLITAVAIPFNMNTVEREKLAEIDAAFRSIETTLRVFEAMTGTYPVLSDTSPASDVYWNDIRRGQLTGKYFTDLAYSVVSDGKTYTITCNVGGHLADDLIKYSNKAEKLENRSPPGYDGVEETDVFGNDELWDEESDESYSVMLTIPKISMNPAFSGVIAE